MLPNIYAALRTNYDFFLGGDRKAYSNSIAWVGVLLWRHTLDAPTMGLLTVRGSPLSTYETSAVSPSRLSDKVLALPTIKFF